jgi:hypothetical protein
MTMNGRGSVVCAALVDRARRQRGRRQVSPDGGKGGEMRSGHIAGHCCIITGGMTSCSPAPTGGIISSPRRCGTKSERDEEWGGMNTTCVIDFWLTWARLCRASTVRVHASLR